MHTDISYLFKNLVYISSVIQILLVVLRPGFLRQLAIKAERQEPDGNIEAGRLWDLLRGHHPVMCWHAQLHATAGVLGPGGGGQVHGCLRRHVHSV